MYVLTGQECCERLAYYGIATNMVIYLKTQLHQHPATASNNVTNWSGTCYITPLIGAFFADAYLGRFWTIVVFSIIYCLVSISVDRQPDSPDIPTSVLIKVVWWINSIPLGLTI